MPKQTFFNLSRQKRQNIEQAALDEFAEYGFDASNMNRIVERSKIAKGSFYQYFENKKDLYFHLIDSLFKKKIEYVEPVLKSYRQHSFSHNLERLIRLGLEFSADDPKLHRIGEDFATMQRTLALEFTEKYKPAAMDIYTDILVSARENDELAEALDISFASFFISSLINQTIILLMSRTESEARRDAAVREMLLFIERAVLKH